MRPPRTLENTIHRISTRPAIEPQSDRIIARVPSRLEEPEEEVVVIIDIDKSGI